MKKTVAIIYHCIDFDGICSLAIARQHFLKRGWNVDPFPYNRGLNVPDIDLLLAYDEVVIVDIALPVKDMVDLAKCWREQGLGLCWIDHHKTSIEDSVRKGYTDIPGLREPVGQGACGLCWEYFHPGTPQPEVVRLLSAYDVWNKKAFDWNGYTLPFQYGMRLGYGLDAEAFCETFDNGFDTGVIEKGFGEETIVRITETGRTALNYARMSGHAGVQRYGFEVSIGDRHEGICCLTNQFGGLAFEEALEEFHCKIAVCVNRIDSNKYVVSLFGAEGNDLDLGAYMKEHYNGGGHKDAAGGTMTLEQFTRLISDCKM